MYRYPASTCESNKLSKSNFRVITCEYEMSVDRCRLYSVDRHFLKPVLESHSIGSQNFLAQLSYVSKQPSSKESIQVKNLPS